jgi:hypothetical protein
MTNPKPTAEDVRAYRDLHECGLETAKAALLKEWRKKGLYLMRMRASELYTIEACRDVIVELLEFLGGEE